MIITKTKFAIILTIEIVLILFFLAFFFFNTNHQFEELLKYVDTSIKIKEIESKNNNEEFLKDILKEFELISPTNRLFHNKFLTRLYLTTIYAQKNDFYSAKEIIDDVLNDENILNDCPFLISIAKTNNDFSPLLEKCLIQNPNNYEANNLLKEYYKQNEENEKLENIINNYNNYPKTGMAILTISNDNESIKIPFEIKIDSKEHQYLIPIINFKNIKPINPINKISITPQDDEILENFNISKTSVITANGEITIGDNLQINDAPIYFDIHITANKKPLHR